MFDPQVVFFFWFSLMMGQGNNADGLAHYFGEDPKRCPFEQGLARNINFILSILCNTLEKMVHCYCIAG